MTEDRAPRTEEIFWAGRLSWKPRGATEVRAPDRLVGRLLSVLCSVDIVKRVVTVKQVRSVPPWGSGRAWAWVCEVPMREHRRGGVCARPPGSARRSTADGLFSVI